MIKVHTTTKQSEYRHKYNMLNVVHRQNMRSQDPDFVAKRRSYQQKLNALTHEPSDKPQQHQPDNELLTILPSDADQCCWKCHKRYAHESCITCKRSFHRKCISEPLTHGKCVECLNAEVTTEHGKFPIDELKQMLTFALQRCKLEEHTTLQRVHYIDEYPQIVNAADYKIVSKRLMENQYTTTAEFLFDLKRNEHNFESVLNLNSYSLSEKTETLKGFQDMLCTADIDMRTIEACTVCYRREVSDQRKPDWFTDVCQPPHPLIWAEVRGHPCWPAKAMRLNDAGTKVDVRFFGKHESAWVPVNKCFLYSSKIPRPFKGRKAPFALSMDEVNLYIQKYLIVMNESSFPYAEHKERYMVYGPRYDAIVRAAVERESIVEPVDKNSFMKMLELNPCIEPATSPSIISGSPIAHSIQHKNQRISQNTKQTLVQSVQSSPAAIVSTFETTTLDKNKHVNNRNSKIKRDHAPSSTAIKIQSEELVFEPNFDGNIINSETSSERNRVQSNRPDTVSTVEAHHGNEIQADEQNANADKNISKNVIPVPEPRLENGNRVIVPAGVAREPSFEPMNNAHSNLAELNKNTVSGTVRADSLMQEPSMPINKVEKISVFYIHSDGTYVMSTPTAVVEYYVPTMEVNQDTGKAKPIGGRQKQTEAQTFNKPAETETVPIRNDASYLERTPAYTSSTSVEKHSELKQNTLCVEPATWLSSPSLISESPINIKSIHSNGKYQHVNNKNTTIKRPYTQLSFANVINSEAPSERNTSQSKRTAIVATSESTTLAQARNDKPVYEQNANAGKNKHVQRNTNIKRFHTPSSTAQTLPTIIQPMEMQPKELVCFKGPAKTESVRKSVRNETTALESTDTTSKIKSILNQYRLCIENPTDHPIQHMDQHISQNTNTNSVHSNGKYQNVNNKNSTIKRPHTELSLANVINSETPSERNTFQSKRAALVATSETTTITQPRGDIPVYKQNASAGKNKHVRRNTNIKRFHTASSTAQTLPTIIQPRKILPNPAKTESVPIRNATTALRRTPAHILSTAVEKRSELNQNTLCIERPIAHPIQYMVHRIGDYLHVKNRNTGIGQPHTELSLANVINSETPSERNAVQSNYAVTLSTFESTTLAQQRRVIPAAEQNAPAGNSVAASPIPPIPVGFWSKWSPDLAKQCSVCHIEATFSCCWHISYCSLDCQKKHWLSHQEQCLQIRSVVVYQLRPHAE